MTDEDEAPSASVVASTATVNESIGDQQLAYADIQIRLETAAHQREMERQRVERELEKTSSNRLRN